MSRLPQTPYPLVALFVLAACAAPLPRLATPALTVTPPKPARPVLVLQEGAFAFVTSVAISPDGKTIATNGFGRAIRLLDARTGELRATLVGVGRSVSAVAWNPDGSRLASLGPAVAGADLLELWDPTTGESLRKLQGQTGRSSSGFPTAPPVFSADGASVAVLDALGYSVSVWDVASGAPRATLRGRANDFQAVTFSPDGATLVTMGDGARLWDARTGALRTKLREPDDDGRTRAERRRLVAFSPDGATLAALASNGKAIKLWDVKTSKVRGVLPVGHAAIGYPFPVSVSVTWSPDGSTLVSTGDALRIWDPRTGALRATLRQPQVDPAWSPDGKTIAVKSELSVQLVDVATGTPHGTFVAWTKDDPIFAPIAFSPDGARLVTGGLTTSIWDASSGALRAEGVPERDASFDSVAWSRDGATLAAHSLHDRGQRDVWLWALPGGSVRTFAVTRQTCPDFGVDPLAWSPDATMIAVGGCADGLLWDADAGTLHRTSTRSGWADYVGWSPDGSVIASANGVSLYRQSRLEFWDAKTGALLTSRQPDENLMGLVWSPDGRAVASPGNKRVPSPSDDSVDVADVHVWNPRTGEVRSNLDRVAGEIHVLAWSPEGTVVAGGGRRERADADDNPPTVWLWDARTGALRATLEDLDHAPYGEVDLVTWSPDGSALASCGDGDVKVWDAREGTLRATLETDLEGCIALAWSPDGATLAAASPASTVRLWDARTGALVRTATYLPVPESEDHPSRPVPNPGFLAFRGDGRVLAVAGLRVTLLRVSDGATLWLDRVGPAGREVSLVYTDAGLFDGDPSAWGRVRFRMGPDLRGAPMVKAEDVALRFRRAHLLADFLASGN